jgi:hypothetical protein
MRQRFKGRVVVALDIHLAVRHTARVTIPTGVRHEVALRRASLRKWADSGWGRIPE